MQIIRGLLISTAANGGVNDCDIIYDAVSTASKGKHTFKTDGTTRLHIDENGYLIKQMEGLVHLM